MAERTRKSLKSQRKLKKQPPRVPGHVKKAVGQLEQMQGIIKNLLGPFAGRISLFELGGPSQHHHLKKRRKKKTKRG